LRTLPNTHHRNHGSDADDNAEHRQARTHLIANQSTKSYTNDHCQVHAFRGSAASRAERLCLSDIVLLGSEASPPFLSRRSLLELKDGKISKDYRIEEPRDAAEELRNLPPVIDDDDDEE
ncbi:MAG TPA: hypothetical protein VNQ74_02985, partial [Burkholderiaceae bacterium]|nr:hypothetical protein [Burkholderiaceae bacterium]